MTKKSLSVKLSILDAFIMLFILFIEMLLVVAFETLLPIQALLLVGVIVPIIVSSMYNKLTQLNTKRAFWGFLFSSLFLALICGILFILSIPFSIFGEQEQFFKGSVNPTAFVLLITSSFLFSVTLFQLYQFVVSLILYLVKKRLANSINQNSTD